MVLRAYANGKRETRLTLPNNLTVTEATDLRQRLLEAVRETDTLTLDLSNVTRVDLSGLQLLFATRRSVSLDTTHLRLQGADNPVIVQALHNNGFPRLDA